MGQMLVASDQNLIGRFISSIYRGQKFTDIWTKKQIFGQMPLHLTHEELMSVSLFADLTKYSFYRYTCFGKFIQCNIL